ncbi:hypothetical protein KR067_008749 [Drosophila pandora]|nr:hypothetical protein KR067_008749 [Drosophila pandora]
MLRRRAEVTCQEMEALHHKVKAAARTDNSSIMALESVEKRLRERFTALQEELEELNFSEIGSDLYWKFSQLATHVKVEIQVEVAKRSIGIAAHSTLLDGASVSPMPYKPAPSLPPLPMPTFSGAYVDWPDFFALFKATIDSHPHLTNMEKLRWLISCLRESALETVRALEITDANYDVALDLLRNRLSNRRLIFQSHINEILQLRVVEPGSVATLRELSDRFNRHMRALMSLGSAAEIQGCLLIQIVLQKLDPATRAKWEDTLAGNNDSLPSWESMARFLEQRCRTLECVDFSLAAYPPSNQVGRGRSSNNRSSCMIINARPALCALCGVLAHPLPTCPSFIALPLSQRYDEVRRLTRCFVCLEDGHFARGCSAARCPKCNRRHHALLHHCGQLPSSNNSPPLRSLGSAVGVAVATPPSQSINTVLTQDRPTEVLLPTANILIRGRSGAFLPCRVLLDSGSQVHLISSRLASQLQLRRTKSCVAVAGLGGTEFATDGSSVNVCVNSRLTTYCANLEAVIVSHIADCQPSLKIDIAKWKIPHGIALAIPNFHRPQGVDLLIGASLFFNLFRVDYILSLYHTNDVRQQRILLGAIERNIEGHVTRTLGLPTIEDWPTLRSRMISEYKPQAPNYKLLENFRETPYKGNLRAFCEEAERRRQILISKLHLEDDTASDSAMGTAEIMQMQLDLLRDFQKRWNIAVNNEKSTTTTTFSLRSGNCPPVNLNGSPIPQEDNPKYLEFTLDRRLTWRPHLLKKRKQADERLRSFYRLMGTKKRILPAVCLGGEPICLLTRPWRKGIPSEPRISKIHGAHRRQAATTRNRSDTSSDDDRSSNGNSRGSAQALQLGHVSPNEGNRKPNRRQATRPAGRKLWEGVCIGTNPERGSTVGLEVGRLS